MGNLALERDFEDAARDLEGQIPGFMKTFSYLGDQRAIQKVGLEFIQRFPPERGLEIASLLSFANPFFVPDIPDENARALEMGLDDYSEFVMRAKLTIRNTNQPNILLACAPKSASTFIQDALVRGLNLPVASLFAATLDGSSATELGASLNEQEPDELALIRAGLNRRGYVAQHHARCSPYMARLLAMYKIRPLVSYRNIFDTLVSLDDMVVATRRATHNSNRVFLFDGLPNGFETMSRDDRLMLLSQRMTTWLVQFYVSWKKCESFGFVRPLWISYEEDFLGDKRLLCARVADWLGASPAIADKLADAFAYKPENGAQRFNKGVAGRGDDVPQAVRDSVLKTAHYYAGDVDLTPLVGFASA